MSNYPPGAKNDPRAPYNQDPPVIEEIAVDVKVGVTIEVPEYAEWDRKSRAVEAALERGDFDLLDIDYEEVLDRRRG